MKLDNGGGQVLKGGHQDLFVRAFSGNWHSFLVREQFWRGFTSTLPPGLNQ